MELTDNAKLVTDASELASEVSRSPDEAKGDGRRGEQAENKEWRQRRIAMRAAPELARDKGRPLGVFAECRNDVSRP